MRIILASTSPYRRQLLERLQLSFSCVAPGTDETARPGEAPEALAKRLAVAKATAVSAQEPQALVIGSDQVASLDGVLLNKPGTHDNAVAQLRACSGRRVAFHTGVCVMRGSPVFQRSAVVPFTVHFRTLDEAQIETYLRRDQPYDCAGSFKVESLGIALFTRLEGTDPTALEGLPLIALADLLEQADTAII